jgi:hypothetical protein
MLPTKFQFIWPSSFRGEYNSKLIYQKQELPMVAMFVNGSERYEQPIEDLPQMCPTKSWFIWSISCRGEDILEIDQSETRIANASHVC